jgi:hypothetical protein
MVMVDIRMELETSGGFGGLSMPTMMLHTSDFTSQYADDLARMVEAAESAPLREAPQRDIPDATRYELTIRMGGAVRRVSFSDVTATPELRRLVQRIQADGTPR